MTSLSDFSTFYQTAFKSILVEAAKKADAVPRKKRFKTARTVYHNVDDHSNEDDVVLDADYDTSCIDTMRDTVKILLSLNSDKLSKEVTNESSNAQIPLPSIDPSIIAPIITDLQANLTKLQNELYHKNGREMRSHLENLFTGLATTDLDQVIECLIALNNIITNKSFYSYKRYLSGNIDRAVLLCAGQCRHFFTTYLTPDLEKNVRQAKRVQQFVDVNAQLLVSLIVQCPIKFGFGISREPVKQLMSSLVPYLVWCTHPTRSTAPFHSINLDKMANLANDIVSGTIYHGISIHCQSDNQTDQSEVTAVRDRVLAEALRLVYEFSFESLVLQIRYEKPNKNQMKQINMSIDTLATLVKHHLNSQTNKFSLDTKEQKWIVWQIKRLFKFYSGECLPDNMSLLDSLKTYIRSIFTTLGPKASWKLVNTENPDDPLFKYLLDCGHTPEVMNDQNYPAQSNVTETNESSVANLKTDSETDPKMNESVKPTVLPVIRNVLSKPKSQSDHKHDSPIEIKSCYNTMKDTLKILYSLKDKATTTEDSTQIPLPSIEPSSLNLLNSDLMTELAKLQDDLFQKNGDEMCQHLETLFARISTDTDLDQTIASLIALNHIITKESFYSYKRYLSGNIDRAVLLCAGQCRHFFTTYLTPDLEKNVRQAKRVQQFVDVNAQLLVSLIVQCPIKFGFGISREPVKQLMSSLVPYLVWCTHPTRSTAPFHSINLDKMANLANDIVSGTIYHGISIHCQSDNQTDQSEVTAVRDRVLAEALRLVYEFSFESLVLQIRYEKPNKNQMKQINMSIDTLATLVKHHLNSQTNKFSLDTKEQKWIVWQIKRLFKFYSGECLPDNMSLLDSLKTYIRSIFTTLGPKASWKLVNTENPDDPLFKYLLDCGHTPEVMNDQNYPAQSNVTETNESSVANLKTDSETDPKMNESVKPTVLPVIRNVLSKPKSQSDHKHDSPIEIKSCYNTMKDTLKILYSLKDKATTTEDSTQIPLPSIEPSSLNLLNSDLMTELAKLQDDLFQKNGDEMCQHLETLFARISTDTDLDQTIASLIALNHIITKESLYSYKRFLIGNVDRIVLLCARQYRFYFTTYFTVDTEQNAENVKRVQRFLESNTQLVTSLILLSNKLMKLATEMTHAALYELIQSLVPYLAWNRSTELYKYHLSEFDRIYHLMTDMMLGRCTNSGKPTTDKSGIIHVQVTISAIVLRMYREFVAESVKMKVDQLDSKHQLNMFIQTFAHFISFISPIYCTEKQFSAVDDDINKSVVYEIHSIFELFSEMDNPITKNLKKTLENIKKYISRLFSHDGCGTCKNVWKHFELVDQEIETLGRNPEEVALFKYLTDCGFNREGQLKPIVKVQNKQQSNQHTKNSSRCDSPIEIKLYYNTMKDTLKILFSLNKSSTNDSLQIPLPSIEPSSLNLLISNLKTRFDKLEDALFQKSGDEMCEYIETLFARLSTDTDLDQAIASLTTLNDILMKESLYSYKRILRGNFDNILFLCGYQYVLFGTTYHKVEPNCVEEVKRVQHFLESSTQLLTSLLLHSPMKLATEMTRTNLYYFIKCTMIYLASYNSTCPAYPTRPFRLFPSFNFHSLYILVTQLANGWYRYNCISAQPNPNTSLLSHVQLNMKATFLRLYREFVAESVKTEAVDLSSKKMLKMNIDAMAKLFEFLCPNYCYDEYFSNDIQKVVVYEIYSIFELFSGLDNSVLERHAKPFWLIKHYISWLFSKLGYDFRICAENTVWKLFELVDKEIAASGRNPQDVPLFKYLAECGFSRSISDQDDDQIEMVEDQVMQSVQKLTKTKVDCETPLDPNYTNNRSNLSIEEKQAILAEVQQMNFNLLKSQQMINELMLRLTNQPN